MRRHATRNTSKISTVEQFCDRLRSIQHRRLAKLELLRRSILEMVFSGNLKTGPESDELIADAVV